jgi:hypothetical protein
VGAAAEVRHELRLRRRLRPDDGVHLRVVDQVHRCNETRTVKPIVLSAYLKTGTLQTGFLIGIFFLLFFVLDFFRAVNELKMIDSI